MGEERRRHATTWCSATSTGTSTSICTSRSGPTTASNRRPGSGAADLLLSEAQPLSLQGPGPGRFRQEGVRLDADDARDQTEKAYATLIPEYIIDSQLAMLDVGNFGRDPEGKELLNKTPTVQLEGPAERRVAVGQPLSLAATAGDDGMPKPRPAPRGGAGLAARPKQRARTARRVVRLQR